MAKGVATNAFVIDAGLTHRGFQGFAWHRVMQVVSANLTGNGMLAQADGWENKHPGWLPKGIGIFFAKGEGPTPFRLSTC